MRKLLSFIISAALLLVMAAPVNALSGTVVTQSTNLNVRSYASTSAPVIGSLEKGASAELIARSTTNSEWWRISYNGGIGYVYGAYISAGGSDGTYKAVNLGVPVYRQYDSRWASVRLGTYGSTIRTIGCTVTSLAMAETYRLGYDVTPADIAATHEFTSGGAIYWKDGYNGAYFGGEAELMRFIYGKLAAGIPVLIHGVNGSGVYHWVTVRGFNGGALTPASFTINDPASEYRLTLADYLAAYPTVVKAVSR